LREGRSKVTRGSLTAPTRRKGAVRDWEGMEKVQKASLRASSAGVYSNTIS
jgi:hypothetical protein